MAWPSARASSTVTDCDGSSATEHFALHSGGPSLRFFVLGLDINIEKVSYDHNIFFFFHWESTAKECDFLWNWITFIGNKGFKYRCPNIDRPPAKFHFGVHGIGRENRKSPDNIHRVGNKCPSVEVAGRISSPEAKAINKQISLLLACTVCLENKL